MISAEKSSGRILWMDYAKAIGIYLVVLGHLYSSASPVPIARALIYNFHMPLFFFISGCFYRDVGIKLNVAKGVKTLIIPALAWNILWWILGACGLEHFVGLRDLLLSLPQERNLPCAVTWFLFACFYCKCMMGLFLNKLTRFAFIVAWAAGFIYLHHYTLAYLGSAIMVFPLYALGYYSFSFRSEIVKIMHSIPIPIKCLAFLACFGVYVSAPIWYGSTSAFVRSFGDGILPIYFAIPTMYLVAFIGTSFVIMMSYGLSKVCSPIKYLGLIGANSLVIMCAHQFFIRFGIANFHRGGVEGLALRIPIAIIIVLISSGVALVIRKFHWTIFTGVK